MLNIYFGDMADAVYNTSVYFNNTYEDEWLTDDFAKEVIKKIDRSEVAGPHAITSPVLGVIPPEKLSGGTKTLLLLKNVPDKVFNASTCGDNCAAFILRLARKKDITINLRHLMDFGRRRFKARVLNDDVIVNDMEGLLFEAHKYV
ncbi:MAG: DUF4869 domain-containing protein [Lachnospiraceae bacterium]|nr:DUF4869 domain-containing protein [Lachnospiraceae bacterium]